MNTSSAANERADRDSSDGQSRISNYLLSRSGQRRELFVLGAALLGTIGIHFSTYKSMVAMWLSSDTFLHCILIAPIGAYLIWERWPTLRTIDARVYYPALLAVLAASFVWWLSDFLGIQVAKQFIVVAMLPLTVLALAGPTFTRAIAFPLGYLVFAVPFGVAVIPYLIDFTTFFVVKALQITGVPVIREGQFFSIPAGNFEVARACSGIRYVLSSLAIGTLYGYLIYHSFMKRAVFFLFALLLPIVANGFRAYGIVLIANYSSMRLAVGADHLIYGWVLFGIVTFFMLWVGSKFKDRPLDQRGYEGKLEMERGKSKSGDSSYASVSVLLLLLVACGPAMAFAVSRMDFDVGPAALPRNAGSWQLTTTINSTWRPNYFGATYAAQQSYSNGQERVDVAVFRYDSQRQGYELANARNAIASDEVWQFGVTSQILQRVDEALVLTVRETIIRRGEETRIVWSWHEVNGEPVIGDIETKWHELLSVMTFVPPVSSVILLSIRVDDSADAARDALVSILNASWRALHDCLYAVADTEFACYAHPSNRSNSLGITTKGEES